MNQTLINITGLHAGLEDGTEILKGLNLFVGKGETHVIMGPNGAGKSTLAHVIMGHPDYHVTEGTIVFRKEVTSKSDDITGDNITSESPDARARRGIFLSFQTPEEVDGITVEDFLRTAKAAVSGKPQRIFPFRKELTEIMKTLNFEEAYAKRYLNVGFSGGEKKKNEILQMLLLNPKLAILDETDSGLDVDAVKTVTEGVSKFRSKDNALLVISHNAKLLENLSADYVHILADGRIVHSGGRELIDTVNREGYGRFTRTQQEAMEHGA